MNEPVYNCSLCLMPLLDSHGHSVKCACDEAEKRGIKIPDDQHMTRVAYVYAVSDYRSKLREIGLIH